MTTAHRTAIRCLAPALLFLGVLNGATSSAVAQPGWTWPLEPVPRVLRGFEPPSSPYGPGHRGVDLAGAVGQPVVAIGAGTVDFAGSVAGRGVVVVDHGTLSSTYQPVNALVSTGDPVVPGQPIGFLELVGSHCLPDPCLHLGVKRGPVYVDPLGLLPPAPVRLKPLGGLDPPTGWPGHAPPWGGLLGPRMGLSVGAAQPLGGDVGVQLGRGQRGMAEDLLDGP